MSIRESEILEIIKSCSKDKASESELESLFSEILKKYDRTKSHLSLLENATKHDYDSILITELSLEEPGPRIVYVNDGFTEMTGYSREEVIGKTPRILQGEKTDRHVLDRLKKRLIDGQAFFGHTVNYRKDGSEFINQWDIHPLTNSEGEITHWVSYQRDITERQETSKVLFDATVDFEELEENSKRTFVDLDAQGNILSSNKSFRETIKQDVDDLKEIKIWDLVAEKDNAEVKELFQDFDASVISEDNYTWEFKSDDDQKLMLEADVKSFVSSDHTIIRIHFDNVSLRNRVIETLKKKSENIEDLLKNHDEFVMKFKKDENGEIYCSYVSESYQDITGLSQATLLDQGIESVVSKKTADVIRESLTKAFGGKRCSEKCEYVGKNDGTIAMIQSFKPIVNEKENKVEAVKSVALLELGID
jgi:PAS domain S-box-containing protein